MQAPLPELLRPTEALTRAFTRPVSLAESAPTAAPREAAIRRGFRMGGTGFATEPNLLMELLESPPIFPIPNTPFACLGLINLRSALVPVFDVRDQVGVAQGRVRWVLVLGRGDEAAGLVVDDLPIQLNLAEAMRMERLPHLHPLIAPHVRAGFHMGDSFYFELNQRGFLQTLAES